RHRLEKQAAGAKARVQIARLAARLKSCPDTSCSFRRVFPQPVKPDIDFEAFAARLKSCPCYKTSEFVCMIEFFRSL
ncbi:MAG: hypothetical protein WBE72_16830, partial [Terracidiphilus sp.]